MPQPALAAAPAPPASAIITLTAITPEKTSTDPTDRSMPAVMITNVIPTDRVNTTEALMKIDLMLYEPRNALGFSTEKITTIRISARKIQSELEDDSAASADSRASDGRAWPAVAAAVVVAGSAPLARSGESSLGGWLTALRPR